VSTAPNAIYYFLKAWVKLLFRVYFEKITFQNKEGRLIQGPCIIISNHPNTMFDALLSAAIMKRMVFFLANYSLFKTPFLNWFFNTFYCIPVRRPQDVKENIPLQNEGNFARATEHLKKNSCLYIAPEGSSFMKRKLRPFKTGTARIALMAEKERDFKLGLHILPIGLNYAEPSQFRSSLHIYIGERIAVSAFREAYERDAFEGVRLLSEFLENEEKKLVTVVENTSEERLVRQMEEILQNEEPKKPEENFFRSKALIGYWDLIKKEDAGVFEKLKTEVIFYHVRLKGWRISDASVKNAKISFLEILYLFFGLPIFIIGWSFHYLPGKIITLLIERLKFYIGYYSTVKLLAGMLIFPAFYILLFFFGVQFFDSRWAVFIIITALPFCGIFACQWQKWWKKLLSKIRLTNSKENFRQLSQSREAILIFLRNFLKTAKHD